MRFTLLKVLERSVGFFYYSPAVFGIAVKFYLSALPCWQPWISFREVRDLISREIPSQNQPHVPYQTDQNIHHLIGLMMD